MSGSQGRRSGTSHDSHDGYLFLQAKQAAAPAMDLQGECFSCGLCLAFASTTLYGGRPSQLCKGWSKYMDPCRFVVVIVSL